MFLLLQSLLDYTWMTQNIVYLQLGYVSEISPGKSAIFCGCFIENKQFLYGVLYHKKQTVRTLALVLNRKSNNVLNKFKADYLLKFICVAHVVLVFCLDEMSTTMK